LLVLFVKERSLLTCVQYIVIMHALSNTYFFRLLLRVFSDFARVWPWKYNLSFISAHGSERNCCYYRCTKTDLSDLCVRNDLWRSLWRLRNRLVIQCPQWRLSTAGLKN